MVRNSVEGMRFIIAKTRHLFPYSMAIFSEKDQFLEAISDYKVLTSTTP